MEVIKQAPSVWIVPQRRRGGLWKTLAAALVLLMLSALAMAEDGRGPDMRSLDTQGYDAVSYTHLDVYKRQGSIRPACAALRAAWACTPTPAIVTSAAPTRASRNWPARA